MQNTDNADFSDHETVSHEYNYEGDNRGIGIFDQSNTIGVPSGQTDVPILIDVPANGWYRMRIIAHNDYTLTLRDQDIGIPIDAVNIVPKGTSENEWEYFISGGSENAFYILTVDTNDSSIEDIVITRERYVPICIRHVQERTEIFLEDSEGSLSRSSIYILHNNPVLVLSRGNRQFTGYYQILWENTGRAWIQPEGFTPVSTANIDDIYATGCSDVGLD